VLDPATASQYASHLYHLVNGQEFNEGKLTDPSQLGVRALNDYTLEVRLRHPVPRQAVEAHGREWTRIGNIVTNGPFLLAEHHTRSRFVLVRNDQYWDAGSVRLEKIIAYAVDDNYTSANLYESGHIDWVPSNYLPAEYVFYMKGRYRDVRTLPFLAVYYYLINTTRPPFDNALVRRALNMALDRRAITDKLLKRGDAR
jgi:ABC-type oligopeptide transport system substrate-binding subunit